MKYFSTFSGVEGIGQGLPQDWECVGFSEFDKYASMVLNYHYPKIKNYGDIEKIKWSEVSDFDLLTGGSPCQNFSIAGKRAGIIGNKSRLVWEFIKCLQEKKPRYFIWENVKGAMSSRGGWDFANIITAFSESGYSLWWQILNAKDFGVAQNRERIFVIGFREGYPKEVFFERQNTKNTNATEWDISSNETKAGGGFSSDIDGKDGKNGKIGQLHILNKGASQHYRVYGKDGIAPTLQSQSGFSSQKHPFIISSTQKHATITKDISSTLPSAMGLGGGHIPIVFSVNTKKGYDIANEGDGINLSFPNSKTRRGRVIKSKAPTLQTNGNGMAGVIDKDKVRKLMPIECERLMGWKDNWTKFGRNEKGEVIEMSDSQRYKMCGNGVVSSVVKKLSEEILL